MHLLKNFNGEWVVSLMLLGFATFYYFEVRSLPNPEINMLLIKPIYFILLVSVILFLSIQVYGSLKKNRSSHESANEQSNPFEKLDLRKSFSFAITTILYIFLIEHIGFVVMTVLYMIILGLLIGIRSKLTLILVPTILVITIYIVFEFWLKLPLPKGVFI